MDNTRSRMCSCREIWSTIWSAIWPAIKCCCCCCPKILMLCCSFICSVFRSSLHTIFLSSNTCRRNDTEVKKELNVWVPLTSASTGTYNFYIALEHEFKKYGIILRKIHNEELENVKHAIAICNFCTRPDADLKEVCNLKVHLQSKLFIIILYLNRENRNTDNIKFVKDRCENIRGIVEMFFTTKLDKAGVKDKENKEALDKLKRILNPPEYHSCAHSALDVEVLNFFINQLEIKNQNKFCQSLET